MADLTRKSTAGCEPVSMSKANTRRGIAGVDGIDAGDLCYVDGNGRIQLAVNTQIWATGSHYGIVQFDGVPAVPIVSGQPGVLYGKGTVVDYAASGVVDGQEYAVSNTAGKYSNTPGATDRPVAIGIDTKRVKLVRGV